MYSGKSVGPRMNPWGTPALNGYSCEYFPSRTIQWRLLLRKEEVKSIIWPEILWDLSLRRRPACQTLLKALDISSATARLARLLKSLEDLQLMELMQLIELTLNTVAAKQRKHDDNNFQRASLDLHQI